MISPRRLATSAKDYAESYVFDDGPAGGYDGNMSQADKLRWKAKLFNKGKPDSRVELRKTFDSTQLVIIVALNGWAYKTHEKPEVAVSGSGRWFTSTLGPNVRMSMNGPLMLTFDQFHEIDEAVKEAHKALLDGQLNTFL